MADVLFTACVLLSVWVVYVFINIPKYEDGVYVPFRNRVRQIPKRLFCARYKQRADDP